MIALSLLMTIFDCPHGFAIPDSLDDPANVYINRTISNCALSCMDPAMFTAEEFDTLLTVKFTSCIVSAFFCFFVLVTWLTDKEKSKQVFVVLYGAVVTVGFIFFTISNSLGQKRLCRNETSPIVASDGITLCIVEAAVSYFIGIFTSICFAMQSMEIFRKMVLKVKYSPPKSLYIGIVLIVPLIVSIVGIFTDAYISTPDVGICNISDSVSGTMISGTMVLFQAVGMFFAGGILLKVLALMRVPKEHGGVSITDGAAMAGTSLKFLLFTGGYLLSLVIIWRYVAETDTTTERSVKWGLCALKYFDGTVASYLNECGSHPHRRRPFAETCFFVVWIGAGFGCFFVVVNLEILWKLLARKFFLAKVSPTEKDFDSKTSPESPYVALSALYATRIREMQQQSGIPEFIGCSNPSSRGEIISSLGMGSANYMAEVDDEDDEGADDEKDGKATSFSATGGVPDCVLAHMDGVQVAEVVKFEVKMKPTPV